MTHALLFVVLAAQSVAAVVAFGRLLPGARRKSAPGPCTNGPANSVTVVVPTVNEAQRLGPCLRGLSAQSDVVAQILVVDSRSTDGTPDLVRAAAALDSRIVLLTDDPAPAGWIGKVWALQHALPHVRTDWVLGVDADIAPQPGLAAGALAAAMSGAYDVVSFAPRFVGMSAAERFVQPAILSTLVYRTGVPGDDREPSRVLANGQCFLARRQVLDDAGGYGAARASWADDVTLARSLASRGARVGFLDGSRLYDVRAYTSLREMWREWGRSVDLSDATGRVQQWADVALLVFAQALPLPVLIVAALGWWARGAPTGPALVMIMMNGVLLVLRLGLLSGLSQSYEHRGVPFWLSPLADSAAVFRITLSTLRRPRAWRGRAFLTESEVPRP